MKKKQTFKQHIRQGVYDLFYIWRQEFRTTFRDQGVLIFFILVPLVYPLIYSFIYTNETLRDVPAVVVDDSRSSLSRQYVRMLDASPDIRVVAHCADMEEAKLALRNRDAYGIVYLPETFSDDIAAGRQTQVSIFCDMSGLMYYKAMLSANTEVSLEMNTEIKIARAGNTTDRQDEVTAYPIEYKDVALYNPTNGFAAFLIPAVLMLIIQQTLLLGIGLSAGTAREKNQFRDLVPINRHYNGTLRIVMGKGLSYFLVYALVSAYVLCVVPWLPERLHLLRHDGLHRHPQPRDVHAAVRLHLRAAAVPFGHLVARLGHPALLALLLVPVPVDLRHQRLRAHQQHGGHTERSAVGIPGPLAANRHLLPDHLPRLPLADPAKPPSRHRSLQALQSPAR